LVLVVVGEGPLSIQEGVEAYQEPSSVGNLASCTHPAGEEEALALHPVEEEEGMDGTRPLLGILQMDEAS